MTQTIVIDGNSGTPVPVIDNDTDLVVGESGNLSTSDTAIDASGSATGRNFYINGTVFANDDYIFDFGAPGFSDGSSQLVVSGTGVMSGAEYGLLLDGGGIQIANSGTVEARLTAVIVNGADTQIVNSGLVTSSDGIGMTIAGANATIINHGTFSAGLRAISGSGANLQLTNNGAIKSLAVEGITSGGANATLTNHGTVFAKSSAVLSLGGDAIITNDGKLSSTAGAGILTKGDDATVSNSGTIGAKTLGIMLYGDDAIVTNDGLIRASAYGISVSADNAIVTNNKTIIAGGGVSIDGSNGVVTNDGTITGTVSSLATIDLGDAVKSGLHNSGLIAAKSIAVLGGSGTQSVFNSGTIKGSIDLGAGNDYFDGTGGKVAGMVSGGKGNDVYVISNASTKLSEAKAGGTDLVKSSVSFTLGGNFENLTLNGKANIKATGNDLANQIHGNGGNNTIKGMAGNDMLWGHAGVDILTGGGGADQFIFNTGDGKDTITDFAATGTAHDKLDLSGTASIRNYADLVKNHMTQTGGDVLIDALHGDSILLKNVKLASLDASDFLF